MGRLIDSGREVGVVEPTESAVIVAVPEAEEAVGPYRAALDRYASWGVPAHVTLLYPFVSPPKIDDGVIRALADVLRTVPAFRITLSRIAWFGDSVVWLAPEPNQPFQMLTNALVARFPGHPPYGGGHVEVIPHLTIGQGAPVEALRAAAAAVEPQLPIDAYIRSALLIQGRHAPGSWQTVAEFSLGKP
jgi:2'-5' RNA ligase superfamily